MSTAKRAGRGTGRDALIDSALQLIGERGLQALTMREIAAVAGMSLGLTTYHFADRDELMREALQRFAETEIRRYQQMLATLAQANASTDQILDALIDGIHATFGRPGYTVALLELYLAATKDPAMSTIATHCITSYRQLTEQSLIAAGMPTGQAERTARWIFVLLDGYAAHAAAAGTPTQLPTDLSDAIHALARDSTS